jgi:hypothetical protein
VSPTITGGPGVINSYEYGFRVPLVVVSPYAKPAHSHQINDFGSILKFIEGTFSLSTVAPELLAAMLQAALDRCRQEPIHLLELIGLTHELEGKLEHWNVSLHPGAHCLLGCTITSRTIRRWPRVSKTHPSGSPRCSMAIPACARSRQLKLTFQDKSA